VEVEVVRSGDVEEEVGRQSAPGEVEVDRREEW
jgi:hypothetical protein